MAPPELPVRILRPGGRLPVRAHPGDAGLDLIAAEQVSILAGGRQAVPTAIAVAIPPGHAGLVVPRSGLARRHGVTVANAPGLIDAGYRGELLVLLVNLGDARPPDRAGRPHRAARGGAGRAARAVAVEELPPSDGRGEGGFGSTG